MPRRRALTAVALSAVLLLAANATVISTAADAPTTVAAVGPGAATATRYASADRVDHARDVWLAGIQLADTRAYLDGVHAAKLEARRQQRVRSAAAAPARVATLHSAAAPTSAHPDGTYLPVAYDHECGGNLPPCWVLDRESGGNLRAWNKPRGYRGDCYAPVGWSGPRSPCGGSTASGKWQFLRSTWNGYGGYLNAADAPADVQNAKAAELWDHGRGCGHWAACG